MTHRGDGDWLEFAAALLREPITELPLDRVTAMLIETFEAGAAAVNDFRADGTVNGTVYPLDSSLHGYREDLYRWGNAHAQTHPIAQYYMRTGDTRPIQTADVPTAAVDLKIFGEGAEILRSCGTGQQLAFPIGPGPVPRTLVVGKPDVYGPEQMRLAERIWGLLDGLDRQARAYASALDAAGTGAADVATSVQLTPRERSVLALLAEGRTAGAIARRLGIAERTVHKHLERCYAKLGVADRLSAVLRAQQLGLVP
jgi:DNA-binding CsgD family transcriptional regulator